MTQFQHKALASEPFKELLHDLNKLVPDPLSAANVDRVHHKWWPDLEDLLSKVPVDHGPDAAEPTRPLSEVLDELVTRVRNVERHVTTRRLITHGRLKDMVDVKELLVLYDHFVGRTNETPLRDLIAPERLQRLVDNQILQDTNGLLRLSPWAFKQLADLGHANTLSK